MKKILIGSIVLFCLVLSFNANAENQCHQLMIRVPQNHYVAGAYCSKGELHEVNPSYVIVRQTIGEGPRCSITVYYTGIDPVRWSSTFEVHQNLCVLKSGNISLTPKGGARPNAVITEGSFSDKRWGRIDIVGFY